MMSVPDPIMDADADLENQINYQALLLHTAKTPEARRAACTLLSQLHAMRSPRQIEKMERERGLR
jgi:hypothetical protein